jgi:uncharacterized protein (DUF58 family)
VVSDLMAFTLLLLAVAGALLERSLLSLVGAVVLALVLVARGWARLALEGLRYSVSVTPPRAFEGDELELTLCIENRKRLPVSRLRIRERLPPGLALIDREDSASPALGATLFQAVTAVAPNERVRLSYRLRALRRGHYVLGPARIEAGDPFGFYTSSREILASAVQLIVYPKLTARPALMPLLARPLGNVVASMRAFHDPSLPAAVREYRPGDPSRAIDWKVTARRGTPHVRVHDASLSGAVTLLLECDTRAGAAEEGSPAMLECCVRIAGSLAAELVARRNSVGVIANGVPPGERARLAVPPGAGPRQLALILAALARVQPIVVKSLAELVAENAGAMLPFGASVICISGIDCERRSSMLAEWSLRGHPALELRVVDPEAPAGQNLRITSYPSFQRQAMAAAGAPR